MTGREPEDSSHERITSAAEEPVLSGIELVFPNSRLLLCEGVWTLMYKGREYARLIEAQSREDAEQQIAEMLFLHCIGRTTRREVRPDSFPREIRPAAGRIEKSGIGGLAR